MAYTLGDKCAKSCCKRTVQQHRNSKQRQIAKKEKENTIQYDSVYLTCSKKLMCNQLSSPHATNRRIKEKRTKNKSKSKSGPVR